jgi:hypothetical protein
MSSLLSDQRIRTAHRTLMPSPFGRAVISANLYREPIAHPLTDRSRIGKLVVNRAQGTEKFLPEWPDGER